MRPDIRYGRVATPPIPSNTSHQSPVPLASHAPSPAPSLQSVDYTSSFICRININVLPSYSLHTSVAYTTTNTVPPSTVPAQVLYTLDLSIRTLS